MCTSIFTGIQIAPASWRELYETAKRRAAKVGVKKSRNQFRTLKRLEEARIRTASTYVAKILRDIALTSPFLESLHPFYRELLKTIIDENVYRLCLSRIYSISKVIDKLMYEHVKRVFLSEDIREIRHYRKAFFGRLSSLLKDLDDCFKALRSWQAEILKLPTIDVTIPSIIIAGAPNVGKSSLLRSISKASPEVKPYPFTTKNVYVGHLELGEAKVQAIDTPGLLDRPLEEKGLIERRTIAALRFLNGIVVFVFDPTITCGFSLDYQLTVYNEVKSLLGETPIVIVSNKVDLTSPTQASELVKMLDEEAKNLIFISAFYKIGIDYMLSEIEKYFPTTRKS
ncbi:MAG: GTPase [Thermofilaceae archaeon]